MCCSRPAEQLVPALLSLAAEPEPCTHIHTSRWLTHLLCCRRALLWRLAACAGSRHAGPSRAARPTASPVWLLDLQGPALPVLHSGPPGFSEKQPPAQPDIQLDTLHSAARAQYTAGSARKQIFRFAIEGLVRCTFSGGVREESGPGKVASRRCESSGTPACNPVLSALSDLAHRAATAAASTSCHGCKRVAVACSCLTRGLAASGAPESAAAQAALLGR